ncbi:MAG: hypothetical protein RIK87_27950 [Fuerstiella sp.]
MSPESTAESGRNVSRQTRTVRFAATSSMTETLDRRLTSGKIPNLTVQVKRRGRLVATCEVRAIGSHEMVLLCTQRECPLAIGDMVSFSISEGETEVLAEESGIIHWGMTEEDVSVVAMFSGSRLDTLLKHLIIDDRRSDIHYPVDLQAFVRIGAGQRNARVIDYSLNGLCLLSHAALETNREYQVTVTRGVSSFCLTVFPRWSTITADGTFTGCVLKPQRGVLFARRLLSPTPNN